MAVGKYTCYLGVQANGKVIAIAKGGAEVTGLVKDNPSVSDLMLASAIYPMTEAQRPADPYAFGGLKIVPSWISPDYFSNHRAIRFTISSCGMTLPCSIASRPRSIF